MLPMKTQLTIALLTLSLAVNAQSFEEKNTTVSNVKVAVTNVGTFGNAFRGYRDGSATTSCEYPAGSGVEHIFESGIWIGGIRNGQELVTTAAVDATQGYITGGSGFEFSAVSGSGLTERSSFKDSPFYTPQAVSHQDYVATFSDRFVIVPNTNIQIQNHTPMFLDVELRTYNFNFAFSDFVVFVDMNIVNRGDANGGENLIDSLHIGLWANTVVRNLNITPAGSGGAAFYDKGGNGYIDSLQMAYCYDHTGDVGFTNSYIGQKFLGASDKFGFHHPFVDSTFYDNYNSWIFNNPGTGTFQAPSGEAQRYDKLTRGLDDETCWTNDSACGGGTFQEQLNSAGNRSDLVSVGPFRDFRKGDTVKISFAFVLAPKLEDGKPYIDNTRAQQAQFRANAQRAQTAFNGEDVNFNGILDADEDVDKNGEITRFILPSPPDIPKTKIVAENNKVTLYWSNNAEASIDPISQTKDFEGYRVFLTKLGFDVTGVPNLLRDLKPLEEYDVLGNQISNEIGLEDITLDSPIQFEGDTTKYYYKYEINNLLNGWQYAVGVSAFDTGDEEQNLESLESSLLANNFRVFPGKKANDDMEENEPYAYPNPYYYGASWEGQSNFQEQSRKLIFANLPKKCVIRIFTPSGDLIDEIYHDENYKGEDIRWFQTFGSDNTEKNKFSGGEHAWDLLSNFTQIISRGVYVFAIEDMETGEVKTGKFAIIK
tara:strand:- start:26571 stop:28700 length:2130 start_codon:yes stop_codon:yes gene_type:complete